MPQRVIAASFALIAFAGAIVAGLAAHNTAATIIERALLAMVVCYVIGSVVGAIGARALDEHIRHHYERHPLDPEQSTAGDEADARADTEQHAPATTAATPAAADTAPERTAAA